MSMPKIVLVDDTRLLLEMAKSFLANSPVQVITAQNGEEALAIIAKERPDLVILDQNMPKMDGITCCSVMRKDPAFKSIPVIMISGSASKEDHAAFMQAGCNAFLAKPLQRQHFLSKVRAFLPAIERRGARVPVRIPVTMEISGSSFTGVAEDISAGGLFMATDYEIIAEGRISLQFRLPGNSENPLITANGRVAWLNSARRKVNPRLPVGFGVEFLEITGEGLVMLRKREIGQFVETGGNRD